MPLLATNRASRAPRSPGRALREPLLVEGDDFVKTDPARVVGDQEQDPRGQGEHLADRMVGRVATQVPRMEREVRS